MAVGRRGFFLCAVPTTVFNLFMLIRSNIFLHDWSQQQSDLAKLLDLVPPTDTTTNGTTSGFRRVSSGRLEDNVTNIPVFYNLYVSAGNENETARVKSLVIDQLSQLRPEHHPIYVNSIGQQLQIPGTVQLQHHTEGQETLTLYSLWKHCQQHRHNVNAKVVYLHSKGALHNHARNDRLRAFVTAGAVSQNCSNLPDTCHVCSIRFAPFPHPHVSGNMWLARCHYVAQLPNPLEFETLMETVPRVHTAPQPYFVGRRRYAAEHWVHSHPSLQPCDVYTGWFTCGYRGAKSVLQEQELQLAHAPRFQLSYFRDRENIDHWTGLHARLEEYRTLYNVTEPGVDWWGWRLMAWVKEAALGAATTKINGTVVNND